MIKNTINDVISDLEIDGHTKRGVYNAIEVLKNCISDNDFNNNTCIKCKYEKECDIYKFIKKKIYNHFNNDFGCNKWIAK